MKREFKIEIDVSNHLNDLTEYERNFLNTTFKVNVKKIYSGDKEISFNYSTELDIIEEEVIISGEVYEDLGVGKYTMKFPLETISEILRNGLELIYVSSGYFITDVEILKLLVELANNHNWEIKQTSYVPDRVKLFFNENSLEPNEEDKYIFDMETQLDLSYTPACMKFFIPFDADLEIKDKKLILEGTPSSVTRYGKSVIEFDLNNFKNCFPKGINLNIYASENMNALITIASFIEKYNWGLKYDMEDENNNEQ